MKFSKIKVGKKVYDRWWCWKVGTIIKKNKTTCSINFPNYGITIYDKAHVQFLEKYK